MKGIREMSMGTPDEPEYHAPLYPSAYKPSKDPNQFLDRSNSSLFDYDNYPVSKKPAKGLIEIKITIPTEDLGPIADDTSIAYNWEIAQNKAEEMAYDKIKELLGDFESKYSIKFFVYDDETQYEVTAELTPVA